MLSELRDPELTQTDVFSLFEDARDELLSKPLQIQNKVLNEIHDQTHSMQFMYGGSHQADRDIRSGVQQWVCKMLDEIKSVQAPENITKCRCLCKLQNGLEILTTC